MRMSKTKISDFSLNLIVAARRPPRSVFRTRHYYLRPVCVAQMLSMRTMVKVRSERDRGKYCRRLNFFAAFSISTDNMGKQINLTQTNVDSSFMGLFVYLFGLVALVWVGMGRFGSVALFEIG